MPRPLRSASADAFFHVLSRGNGKQEIFLDDYDYLQFLDLMGQAYQQSGFIFHAYCLMPNHYHLLIQLTRANLSDGMRRMNGIYAQKFNYRHHHVGHLFQDRFKSFLVGTDAYRSALSRYIHRNPVEGGLAAHPCEYRWSSCQELLRIRPAPCWLDLETTLRHFGDDLPSAILGFEHFLDAGVDKESPDVSVGRITWGGDIFGAGFGSMSRELPDCLENPPPAFIPRQPSAAEVEDAVAKILGDDSMSWEKGRPNTRVAALLLSESAGLEHKEIAARYGTSCHAVTKALSRLRERIPRDEHLGRQVEAVRKLLQSAQCQVGPNVRV